MQWYVFVVFLLEVGFQLPLAASFALWKSMIEEFEAGSVFGMVLGSTSSGIWAVFVCYQLLLSPFVTLPFVVLPLLLVTVNFATSIEKWKPGRAGQQRNAKKPTCYHHYWNGRSNNDNILLQHFSIRI